MLTNKNIVCPENLLKIAKGKGPVKAVIVNAVKKVAIESAKQAVEANLITPLFVGDKSIIEKISKILPVLKSPTVLPLGIKGWSSMHSVIDDDKFWEVIDKLKAEGAEDILVCPIEKMVL